MKVLELFDDVGVAITVDQVRSFLNKNKDQELQFDISTLGGDLDTAITINNLIRAHPKNTTANIVGLTASAGTVIALGCDHVQMSDNALFLIHNGWKEVTGNIYDFQQAVKDMSKTDALMVKIYKEKSGLDETKIVNLMKASDWLLPQEAIELGFVDEVYESGVKVAASAVLKSAKNKVNNKLLIKLEEKMNLFGKKDDKTSKAYPLALADGNSLVMNAEEPAADVEVMPLGAMTLEDGEYELADGRKIMVAGGVITEVVEKKEEDSEAKVASEEILNTVAQMLTNTESKIEAMVEAKLKPLAKMKSNHEPPKGKGPANTGDAKVNNDLQAKIEAKQAEIKAEIEKKRKG